MNSLFLIPQADNISLTRFPQKDNKRFLDNVYEIVTEYEDRLILFDLDDENYDGLDAALLEALVTAQVSGNVPGPF